MLGIVVPEIAMAIGLSGTIEEIAAEHPLPISVTVTVYVPAEMDDKSSDVAPLDQRKEYDPAGVTLISSPPLLWPQVAGVITAAGIGGEVLLVTV